MGGNPNPKKGIYSDGPHHRPSSTCKGKRAIARDIHTVKQSKRAVATEQNKSKKTSKQPSIGNRARRSIFRVVRVVM